MINDGDKQIHGNPLVSLENCFTQHAYQLERNPLTDDPFSEAYTMYMSCAIERTVLISENNELFDETSKLECWTEQNPYPTQKHSLLNISLSWLSVMNKKKSSWNFNDITVMQDFEMESNSFIGKKSYVSQRSITHISSCHNQTT